MQFVVAFPGLMVLQFYIFSYCCITVYFNSYFLCLLVIILFCIVSWLMNIVLHMHDTII